MTLFPLDRRKKIIAGAAIAALGAWYFLGGHGGNETKAPAVTIKATKVTRQDVPIVLHQVGTAFAYQTVAVRSRMDSQIMAVNFKDGDEVHAGDVLFQLDDRQMSAQLKAQEANIERDKAQLNNLREQYQRVQALTKKGYESQSSLDAARAAYEAQAATAHATDSAAENLRVQLQYTKITAPIDGRTGTISVTVGNTVKANDVPLVTINQIKPIRVQMSLPQQYLDNVRSAMNQGGVAVTARQEGNPTPSEGTLEYFDNAIDQSSGTFAARATFANENEALWPGMFVTIEVRLGMQAGALAVPEVAVQHGQEGDYVFVIEENAAHKRPVKVSRIYNSQAVIEEGVKEGETVATDGLMSLREGSAVQVNSDTP